MPSTLKKSVFRFTSRLAERVGREKKKTSCSSAFKWYSYQIEVAHRTWEDHYVIYQNDQHIASFTNDGEKLTITYTCEGWVVKQIR